MTSDRWRQIEEVCHAALARSAAERQSFLAQACANDEQLRHEVQSLLAHDSDADGFMNVPAAALAGSVFLAPPEGTLVGTRFGVYDIRSLLGVGGMGEVYRAHDGVLDREVAIKVLPAAFTTDPERRARLEREARMLATLNHPHIGAIYSVEEAGGVRGLILELVEGETLAELIAEPPPGLSLAVSLRIARQIADALDAAHERGVVHRDLKPANIKITTAGTVKVLDFGLAKAAGAETSQPSLAESHHGAILGTAAYMSPEQARGLSVDKRGDIWAFGCVLYEMLTGRLAFSGETASDTIAKVLEHEPDWSALPAGTPAPIRRLLHRCLTKDAKHRLRDIGDARLEIDSIEDGVPGVAAEATASPVSASARMKWLPWAALALLTAGIVGWEATRPSAPPEDRFAAAQFSRLTDWEGTETAAEISPDGKFVAFLSDAAGQFDIWLKQVGTGGFINLTANLAPLDAPGPLLRTFGFSGDGAEIWFSLAGDVGGTKLIMPLTGGTPRPFLGSGDIAPSWSFDDARLAYFNNAGGDPLFVADRTGGDASPIIANADSAPGFFDSGVHNHNPKWSVDGRWIYFAHGIDPTDNMDVWRIRPSGGSPERLTEEHTTVNFVAPLDLRTLLYIARAKDRSGPYLWSLDVERKTTRRVSTGLETYTSVSATRDGHRVVATVANPASTLWSVPLLDRPAEDRDTQRHLNVRAFAPRFGGTSLFYLSASGTSDGLWRVQDGAATEVWKSSEGRLSEPPAVSRDGRQVAIVVRQAGKRHIVVMSDNGTSLRTVATSVDIEAAAGQGAADWSPDGAWIVMGGRDADGPGLFKIPVGGGAAVRLVAGPAINPVWSPDGRLIIYAGPLVAGQVQLFGVTPDGAAVPLPDVRTKVGGAYRFLPNGRGLVYIPRNQSLDFWLLDFASQTTRPVTRLSDDSRLGTFDVTPDGTRIVFDRLRDNSDVVLIDLPQ